MIRTIEDVYAAHAFELSANFQRPPSGQRRAAAEFDAAVPAAKHGRDILEHFDEYASGRGKLQQRDSRKRGHDVFEAAATYCGGSYDPSTEELTQGAFVIVVPDALEAAQRLHQAIYAAGLAVDRLGRRRES
jgi:hypothetical protein